VKASKAVMHHQGESFQSPTTTITNNNTVCESCDSNGHFARDCPHRKLDAVTAQKKRDATWAEKNSVQASDLQDFNQLIKEAERLHAIMMADCIQPISLLAMQMTWSPKTTVVLRRVQQ